MQTFPIIEKLGGRDAVFGLLRDRPGVKVKTSDTIRMWIQRGSIPGPAQRALMAAADQRQVPYSAQDFVLLEVPEPEEDAAAPEEAA